MDALTLGPVAKDTDLERLVWQGPRGPGQNSWHYSMAGFSSGKLPLTKMRPGAGIPNRTPPLGACWHGNGTQGELQEWDGTTVSSCATAVLHPTPTAPRLPRSSQVGSHWGLCHYFRIWVCRTVSSLVPIHHRQSNSSAKMLATVTSLQIVPVPPWSTSMCVVSAYARLGVTGAARCWKGFGVERIA